MKTKAILRIADTFVLIRKYEDAIMFLKKVSSIEIVKIFVEILFWCFFFKMNGEEDRNSEALLIRGLAEKGLSKNNYFWERNR